MACFIVGCTMKMCLFFWCVRVALDGLVWNSLDFQGNPMGILFQKWMQNHWKWHQNERKYTEIWWPMNEYHWHMFDILLLKFEGALKLNVWVQNEQIEGNCWWNLKENQLTSMENWWQISENQRTKYWKMNDWLWIVSYIWSYFCATSLKFKVWVVSEQVVLS